MKPSHIQILTLALVITGLALIAFLYRSAPRSLAEVSTKGSVAIGTYNVDQTELSRGLSLFRKEEFEAARSAFAAADPERLDALTQFYIAYAFYRQGWGRVSNDDRLFNEGLRAVDRSIQLDQQVRTAEADLVLKTPHELKAELEDGLRITASDFNPLKLTRERK